MTEKVPRKESLPEAVVLCKKKKRADITSEETVRIRHLIFDILLYAKLATLNRDANSAKKCKFKAQKRLPVSLKRNRRKVVEKGSCCLIEEFKAIGCCVFQDTELPKFKSILWKSTKSFGPKRSVQLSKGTLRHVKNSGKKGSVHRKVLLSILILMSVAPMLQKTRTDLRNKP